MSENVNAIEKNVVKDMLFELLEKVNHHDGIVEKKNKKLKEIKAKQAEINVPRQKFKFVQKFFGVLLVVIGWIILLVVYLVRNNKYKKHQAKLAEELMKLQKELDVINSEYDNYVNKVLNPYIESIVPNKFPKRYSMNALAIEGMLCLLIDMRADTLKEAMNLYEECMHRVRIEALIGITNTNLLPAIEISNLRLEETVIANKAVDNAVAPVEETAKEVEAPAEDAAEDAAEEAVEEIVEEVVTETEVDAEADAETEADADREAEAEAETETEAETEAEAEANAEA